MLPDAMLAHLSAYKLTRRPDKIVCRIRQLTTNPAVAKAAFSRHSRVVFVFRRGNPRRKNSVKRAKK